MRATQVDFVFAMARHSEATLEDIKRLMRYACKHHDLAERHCNGDCPYIHNQDETCTRQLQVEAQIEMLVTRAGLVKAIFQNDPRGLTVKVVSQDGYTNDFVREGIAVPGVRQRAR